MHNCCCCIGNSYFCHKQVWHWDPASGKSVTVEGVSTIKALPDVISVYFSIETNGSTSAEAKDANTKIYDDLVEQITIAGFNESDLKTESFNVYPNTYWDGQKQRQMDLLQLIHLN